jgi:hypothetical protein
LTYLVELLALESIGNGLSSGLVGRDTTLLKECAEVSGTYY